MQSGKHAIKINKLFIDLEVHDSVDAIEMEGRGNINLVDFYFENRNNVSNSSADRIDVYSKLSFGEKVKASFTQNKLNIPPRIEYAEIIVSEALYKKSNLGKYLVDFAARSGADIVSWACINSSTDKGTVFKAEFKNVNPYAFLGSFAAAIKAQSASLGQKAVLLDVKKIEQIPEIVKHIDQYLALGV